MASSLFGENLCVTVLLSESLVSLSLNEHRVTGGTNQDAVRIRVACPCIGMKETEV